MATGNQVLPGAQATTERAVTAQQQMAGRGAGNAGRPGEAGWPGEAAGYVTGDPDEQPQRIFRRGTGGRWLVWVLRAVVWIVLLLIGYRGIAAIVTSYEGKSGTGSGAVGQAANGFPVALASAFAQEFGLAYLNFSPATAAQRASELTAFLPAGTSPQLGWNGSGSQTAQSVQAAGVRVQSAHSAIVSLLALVNGRLIELDVPVYYSGDSGGPGGGLVVSGQPALTAPPAGAVLPAVGKVTVDRPAQQALTRVLPAFFRAYASGRSGQLAAFAAPGARLSGLGGEVGFGGIAGVSVPASGGSVRNITVTVTWLPATTPSAGPPTSSAPGRAQIEMTYAMTVVQRAGRWYVSSIGAAPTPAGPSS
jgi:hypothetical protein